MTPRGTPKGAKRGPKPTCPVCANKFSRARGNIKYCSDACRTAKKLADEQTKRAQAAAKKAESLESRLLKFNKNNFGGYILQECRKAGTVQILTGFTADTFHQLHQLYHARRKALGFEPAKEEQEQRFHLCHVFPRKHISKIGTLHPHNLFIGDAVRNQKHQNGFYEGAGLSIPRLSLETRYRVAARESDASVRDKIVQFCGEAFTSFLLSLKAADLKIADRYKNAALLVERGYRWPDGSLATLKELERTPNADLLKMLGEASNIPAKPRRSTLSVYLDECSRLGQSMPTSQHQQDIQFMEACLRIVCSAMSRTEGTQFYQFANALEKPLSVLFHPVAINPETGTNEQAFSRFRDSVAHRAFETLQGRPLDKAETTNYLRKHISPQSWIFTEQSAFYGFHGEQEVRLRLKAQAVKLLEDLQTVGLIDEFESLFAFEQVEQWNPTIPETAAANAQGF